MYSSKIENKDIRQSFSSFDEMNLSDLNSPSLLGKTKDFLFRKRLYIIIGTLLISTIVIIIVATAKGGDNENSNKNAEPMRKFEPFSPKYYSEKTRNYMDYMASLEQDNYIVYQYNFQNNSQGSFANKYQHLHNVDTSLIPNNSELGNYFFKEESYLTVETNEIDYYRNVLNQEPPKHYIYGPSSIQEEYNRGQRLSNPNIKLNNTHDWEGMTLSLNIKHQPFMGNSNGGHIFGWGTSGWRVPGFFIALTYGVVYYKQGRYNVRYDYADSVKLGYNASIPETRYLTYRPLTDKRWHQITISMRKVTLEDEPYLTELNLREGNYKTELFIDGESRKNATADLVSDYGELSAFSFELGDKMKHNGNFYIDNIIVLKKGINITEAEILFDSIDQEAAVVIPDIPNERCKIPGERFGVRPQDVYPESQFPLRAETRFFQFTNKWSCLGFSYEEFLKERLGEFCGDHLRTCDLHYYYNRMQAYQLDRNYRFDIFDVLKYYLPQINEKFGNLENFTNYVHISSTDINGNDLQNHIISNFGYWISSEGVLQVDKFSNLTSGTMKLPVANINYFAYFEIEGGYINNRIYKISVENSDDIQFVYNEHEIISHAIKVNQVGYSPRVKNHYGYIGRWMGTLGKLNVSEYVGQPFKLMQNNQEVYTGIIEWRTQEDPRYVNSGHETDLNGEETLLLDISNYTGTGENYYFYIEGIGISFNFSISYKSVFTAFYTHMKGLYNQRTGIEHVKPYSYWETPPHHKGIYVAHHIPNNYHYGKYITDDDTGELYKDISQFEMIKETRTDEYWGDVFGGHADAGDYDNRPYHLQMIDVLACVFLLRKDLLMDNQLNIPESNDTIPDILNEMEWSLQIHYLVQQKLNNGSVSTWIESTSHPAGLLENGTDTGRYYIGLSTREDTLRYVEAAGMLALCFKECDTCPQEKYQKWLASAEWAFEWGILEENSCVYHFKYKGRNLTYTEPEVPIEIVARAALILYRLTHDDKYKPYIFKDINATKVDNKYTPGVVYLKKVRNINPIDSLTAAIFRDDPDFALFMSDLNKTMFNSINQVLKNQNNGTQNTYRNANYYEKSHPYYSSLGWGGFTAGHQISLLGVALYLNNGTAVGDKLLQSIAYFYDFELGCNHYGRTFTTGLGHHFPIHFVSHNNWWFNDKKIFDPIPGITLYTFFGGLEYDAFNKFFRITYDREDTVGFKGINVPVCPSFFNLTEEPVEYAAMRDHLWEYIPFWRRYINLEGYSIRSSEYTVYETIVRMALSSGLLLGSDENIYHCNGIEDCPSLFPSEELKHKAPRTDIKDLLGRWTIP